MQARVAGIPMHRIFKTLFLLPCLSACAPSLLHGGVSPAWESMPGTGVRHDFNWRLSGDRQVAPVQVFDDGRQTWLQFAPGQATPAIFVEHNGVEHPAAYTRREPYVVVRGKWPSLVMRGGSLRARADYLGAAPGSTAPAAVVGATHSVSAAPSGVSAVTQPGPAAPPSPAPSPAASRISAAAPSAALYRVTPSDDNMRRALARWAGLAGWTFQPEHWAVDVDIPLSASASFSDDFKASVRALLAATELGERPLQPCFYANQVLRVVPLSQACDRTVVRAGASS
jgi:hypothetical protein